jgi:hypothetical protein
MTVSLSNRNGRDIFLLLLGKPLTIYTYYNILYSSHRRGEKWLYIDPKYPEAHSFDLEPLDRPNWFLKLGGEFRGDV